MNEATQKFLDELKQRDNVVGVIMFGSWARGNNRPDSDVDLVIILTEGYRRTVEHRDGQDFEIIYTTEKGVFQYWESHKDESVRFWEIAKVLYDKDGSIKKLEEKTRETFKGGKKPLDEFQIAQFKFSAEDTLRYIENALNNGVTNANFLLNNEVSGLIEVFFNVRQLWIPAPKQRLEKIKDINHELSSLLEEFYQDHTTAKNKLEVVKRIILIIFEKEY